jgi:tetratricopeptide (TPR) repeat protein
MGYALLGLEEFAAARSFFDSASNLRPAQANAYYGMAIAHEGLGEMAQAVAAMQAYAHIAAQDDPYRRKAEAAIWEWQVELSVREK